MLQSSSTQKNPVSWQHKRQESILLKLLKIIVGLEGLVIPRKLSARGRAGLFICIGRTLNIDRLVNTSLPLVNESTKFIKTCVECIVLNIKHRGSTPLASTILRGYSSVGRASALQAECHRFDPGYLQNRNRSLIG